MVKTNQTDPTDLTDRDSKFCTRNWALGCCCAVFFALAAPFAWAGGFELTTADHAGTSRTTFWRDETIVIQTNAASASPARAHLTVRDDTGAVCFEGAMPAGRARIKIGRWRAARLR